MNILEQYNIDPRKFKIKKDSYFNGDEKYTSEEYSKIYCEVANWCTESRKYSMDDYGDYFTVRTDEEKELVRYKDLTPDEKKEYDKKTHNESLLKEINELKKEMTDNDYKQMKYIRGEYSEEEWEEIKFWFQEKASQIRELESQLIN